MDHQHCIVNLSKHAGYEPRSVGNAATLTSLASEGAGALGALVLLLDGNWGGENIAIVGDQAAPGDLRDDVLGEAGIEDPTQIHELITNSAGTTWRNQGWLARKVLTSCDLGRFGKPNIGRRYSYRPQPNPDLGGAIADGEGERVIVNLDTDELVTPAGFGDDPRLGIFAVDGGHGGILTALAVLLAGSNKGGARGEGDLLASQPQPLVGSWASDRIMVTEPDAAIASTAVNIDAPVRQVLTNTGTGTYVQVDGDWRRDRPRRAA